MLTELCEITTEMDLDSEKKIKQLLVEAGWLILVYGNPVPRKVPGVALQNVPLARGYGQADFILFIEGKAAGVIESHSGAERLRGLPADAEKYRRGLPFSLRLYVRPLPFLYQSTGHKTQFTMGFDIAPQPRAVAAFHRPETLKYWLEDGMVGETPRDMAAEHFPEYRRRGRSFHERLLINMPALETEGLSGLEWRAIQRLETALKCYKRRMMIEMSPADLCRVAIGYFIFRVVRYADACRVLVLVHSKENALKIEAVLQQQLSQAGEASAKGYLIQKGLSIAPSAETRFCFATLLEVAEVISSGSKGSEPSSYRSDIPIEAFDLIVWEEGHKPLSGDDVDRLRVVTTYFDAVLLGFSGKIESKLRDFFSGNILKEDDLGQAEADGLGMIS